MSVKAVPRAGRRDHRHRGLQRGGESTAVIGLARQRLATEAEREEASAQRRANLAYEERDRRRAAYGELGDHLQEIFDVLNYIVGPVLQTSTRPNAGWVIVAEAGHRVR